MVSNWEMSTPTGHNNEWNRKMSESAGKPGQFFTLVDSVAALAIYPMVQYSLCQCLLNDINGKTAGNRQRIANAYSP